MNKQISDISIEILAKYSEKDAAAIGRLLPILASRLVVSLSIVKY